MNCPNCGALNSDEREYCAVCDALLSAPGNTDWLAPAAEGENEPAGENRAYEANSSYESYGSYGSHGWEYSNADMAAFIDKSQPYYMEKFDYFSRGNKLSWNWCAFLFGVAWLAYRKMYKYTLIFVVLSIGLTAIIPQEYTGLSLVVPVVTGLIGNYLYMLHAQTKMRTAAEFSDQIERINYIRRSGGVSWRAVVAVCLIFIMTMIATVDAIDDAYYQNILM
ncbi:MAG: DUF2628 domain-containing protein [Gracilibacteraceae bacterium]|jgi:hypothetical protein|nr:DUF2628 domain-containing protein [Gracilibacteraceae bacterium]